MWTPDLPDAQHASPTISVAFGADVALARIGVAQHNVGHGYAERAT